MFFYFFFLKILLMIKVETLLQFDYNRIVTYLVSYQVNHVTDLRPSAAYENEKHCTVHSAYMYVIGDLGTTYDVHLGLIGKPAPAPVPVEGLAPLNKICPPPSHRAGPS